MPVASSVRDWLRVPISSIEDLSDAVLGAGLEATQMSTGPISGGLAFSASGGVICTSGLINGRVSLFGPLSPDMITLGVALRLAPGTRHWLNEVETGNVGVFLPGDVHDAIYTPGSLYAAITASAETLEGEAAKEDLILDRHILGGTGVHARNIAPGVLWDLERSFQSIHEHRSTAEGNTVGSRMLAALVAHIARPPHHDNVGRYSNQHGKIVERARGYIRDHLDQPMSVDEIADAAHTSRRTLFRAFGDVFDEAPHHYVRRLRLHRIRHDLASEAERACTIALVANQWGLSDLGRMSGWYRELFGERPSETIAALKRIP